MSMVECTACGALFYHWEEHLFSEFLALHLSIVFNTASVHTLMSPCRILAEQKGLSGGVGSPGEMTTSWVSPGEVSIC